MSERIIWGWLFGDDGGFFGEFCGFPGKGRKVARVLFLDRELWEWVQLPANNFLPHLNPFISISKSFLACPYFWGAMVPPFLTLFPFVVAAPGSSNWWSDPQRRLALPSLVIGIRVVVTRSSQPVGRTWACLGLWWRRRDWVERCQSPCLPQTTKAPLGWPPHPCWARMSLSHNRRDLFHSLKLW